MVERYSVLKLSTGLEIAAFIAWKLIVSTETQTASMAVNANTCHDTLTRYAKFCSHLSMAYHAMGQAIITARSTSFRKSFDNKATILPTLTPNSLRTPISFVR